MIYGSGNKVFTFNGKFGERKVRTLTFQVQGDRFPVGTSGSSYQYQFLKFVSFQPNSVTVNYGDGNTETYMFVQNLGRYEINFHFDNSGAFPGVPSASVIPVYYFQDANTGLRNISFEFENLQQLSTINPNYIELYGQIPVEISEASSLQTFSVRNVLNLNSIPTNSIAQSVTSVTILNALATKLNTIPDSFFSAQLEFLSISGSFNLNDHISSNLFKINQLKNTLEILELDNNDLNSLPNEIEELQALTNIRLLDNDFSELPDEIFSLVNLETLAIGDFPNQLTNNSWKNISNLENLESLRVEIDNMDLSDLANDWIGLKSLSTIVLFSILVRTDARFDEFINSFYTLCTNEANITEDPNAFGGVYPNRFRNISWGNSSLTFSGTYQAPSGYVQGGNNGTPANEGEKVYVLINQYGHTVDSAN